MIRVTFEIDPSGLPHIADSHLHAMWHVAQANPAPVGDREAGRLVAAITAEIVRRWLQAAPVDLHHHRPEDSHWRTLVQHGSWRGPGGAWLPHERVADAPPPT